jgi:hypothetical protein
MYPVKRLLDAETENMRDQLAAEYTARTGVGQPVPQSPTARSLQWEPSDYYMKSGLADPALLDQVEEAVVETKTFVLCADKAHHFWPNQQSMTRNKLNALWPHLHNRGAGSGHSTHWCVPLAALGGVACALRWQPSPQRSLALAQVLQHLRGVHAGGAPQELPGGQTPREARVALAHAPRLLRLAASHQEALQGAPPVARARQVHGGSG